MPAVRQQAWDLLIARHAIQSEFSKVGITVTDDEIWDMIQGKNIDENVKQAFTNQETGQFERDRVVHYLNQLKTMPRGFRSASAVGTFPTRSEARPGTY